MNAKWIKTQSSTAKRTATALRGFAKSYGVSPEDSGIMLAAARAVDALAVARSTEAKLAKRKEDELVAFFARAEKEAWTKIRADWPISSVLDKVTMVALNKLDTYLSRSIDNAPERAQRLLDNYFDTAASDICREAASRSWNRKITVTEALCSLAREWDATKVARYTVSLADKINAIVAPQTLKAN